MSSSSRFWARIPGRSGVKTRIAVIGGGGRMGRWIAGYLHREGWDVVISDKDEVALHAAGHALGVDTATSNAEAARGADYVLLSVPLPYFEEAVAELRPQVQESQVVLDITSVKVKPVAMMHRYFPRSRVLGIHPLFGPGARDVANQNFVLTPTGKAEASLAGRVRHYLEGRGARVVVMSPQEHDEAMSLVLALSHFIAIAAADTLLGAGGRPLETAVSTTYKVLLTMIESVLSEDPELYATIQMNLPRAVELEKLFLERTAEWAGLVSEGKHTEFVRRMKELKTEMRRTSPSFDKAYEDMYRIVEGL